VALAIQWFAFTGLWYADMRATSAGWTPPWYSQYRFYLSILVGTCILGSLAGVNVWGPVPGVHSAIAREVEQLKSKRLGESTGKGTRHGLLSTSSHLTVTDGTEADADAYVLIGHPKEGEDEQEEGKRDEAKQEEPEKGEPEEGGDPQSGKK